MTDQEFIELLNLYVDREISASDAARLEAAVLESPRRRSIYDQYCKMQKACRLLSDRCTESEADAESIVFPAPSGWRAGPLLMGLAAACLLAVVGLRFRGALAPGRAPRVSADPAGSLAVSPSAETRRQSDGMQPVYFAHAPAQQAARGVATLFANSDPLAQPEQLNWIGDIHLAPVAFAPAPEFLLGQRPDLKAAVLTDSKDDRELQPAAEMIAFRFQR
ncbi:MAG TPA: zf-HC2 domain-containing protein [Opitutaceae bacterium]